jgi:hypothetical protein
MRWNFWKRRNNADENPGTFGKAQGELGEEVADDCATSAPLLNARSATELLGLQRLVGNQAVLQMVRARPAPNHHNETGRRTNVS